MKKPEISNYRYKISLPDGTIKEVFRDKEYVADLAAHWQEAYAKSEQENAKLKGLLKELSDLAERNNFSVPYYITNAL